MTSHRISNRELVEIFQNIANLLEIKGEVIYKILAYRKAADSLNDLGRDIYAVWQEGGLEDIPGVGKAIAEKIDELLSTGELGFYEKLKSGPSRLTTAVGAAACTSGMALIGLPLVAVLAPGGGARFSGCVP